MIGFSGKTAKRRLIDCLKSDRSEFNAGKLQEELEDVIKRYASPEGRLRLDINRRRHSRADISAKVTVRM